MSAHILYKYAMFAGVVTCMCSFVALLLISIGKMLPKSENTLNTLLEFIKNKWGFVAGGFSVVIFFFAFGYKVVTGREAIDDMESAALELSCSIMDLERCHSSTEQTNIKQAKIQVPSVEKSHDQHSSNAASKVFPISA